MSVALAVALPLILAAGAPCYFISNTRIRALPSCDIDPSTIDELTEQPAPASMASAQQRQFAHGRWNRAIVRSTIVVRGNEELERRLELADQQRLDAVAERIAVEKQRDIALQQRDRALRELAKARGELATLRARAPHAGDTNGRRQEATRGAVPRPLAGSHAPAS